MIHKTSSHKPGHVRVVFELPASTWADRVSLVGDFNEWSPSATPFIQDRRGRWWAAVDLPTQKRYAFRYLIDGEWHTDFKADGWIEDALGHQNSVIKLA